jgi:hypothetical protein
LELNELLDLIDVNLCVGWNGDVINLKIATNLQGVEQEPQVGESALEAELESKLHDEHSLEQVASQLGLRLDGFLGHSVWQLFGDDFLDVDLVGHEWLVGLDGVEQLLVLHPDDHFVWLNSLGDEEWV